MQRNSQINKIIIFRRFRNRLKAVCQRHVLMTNPIDQVGKLSGGRLRAACEVSIDSIILCARARLLPLFWAVRTSSFVSPHHFRQTFHHFPDSESSDCPFESSSSMLYLRQICKHSAFRVDFRTAFRFEAFVELRCFRQCF